MRIIRYAAWLAVFPALALMFAPRCIAQALSYDDLFYPKTDAALVPDQAFTMPRDAVDSKQAFEGDLDLLPPSGYGFATIISTKFDSLRTQTAWKQLPPFHVTFVQSGSHLIPTQQGLLYTGSLGWNLIVGPGRVWQQSEDHGYARASLPFALIERGQNCVHNGALTFLFRNGASPNISGVRYQITQETCDYMKADMWGQIPARYTPHTVAKGQILRQTFQTEMSNRVPSKPLSALASDFPQAHFDVAALLRGRKHPDDVTLYGIYIDGINYVSACPTRHGEYSFCEEMRVPSYSTAKSAFAGVAMMRLGELFGSHIYEFPISTYLPSIGEDDSWNKVTFSNALDMASGHFHTTGFEQDEDGPELRFLIDESLEEKLKDALLHFPVRTAPGKIFNYQSHNTFLATVAMQRLLQQKRGPRADLFTVVSNDIYEPLHVSSGMLSTVRTDNSPDGQPAGYFGLFYLADDVVKLGRFLNDGDGQIDGKTTLDPQRLRESLFRDPETQGLITNDPRQVADTVHYNHAFWARHYTRAEYPDLRCDFWAPYLSGYGGITIALLPNHAVFYVFSDADEFVFNDAVLETNKLSPLCPAK